DYLLILLLGTYGGFIFIQWPYPNPMRTINAHHQCATEEKMMNRWQWQGKLQEVRDELAREWEKLTEKDLHSIEDELDRIVGLFEKRYGYSSERALAELERYVDRYGERTRAVLNERLKAFQKKPKQALPLLWGLMTVVGMVALLRRFRAR
ncbi:MAG: hypothetical protein KDE58_16050, partial [Caldilineaceae bacterium]|nr:hypothetical protein [Caldilineaceae bacterium]